jgi:hypothetical protein
MRPLEDPDQAAGDETADRCVFWSGEQNRWVDVISAWITEHDPWRPGEDEHRGFAISVEGDMCMPLAAEPLIEVRIGPDSKRVCVKITMPAPLWRELVSGWDKFVREAKKAIFLRCGLKCLCTKKRHCLTCDVYIRNSWGALIRCHVSKIPDDTDRPAAK